MQIQELKEQQVQNLRAVVDAHERNRRRYLEQEFQRINNKLTRIGDTIQEGLARQQHLQAQQERLVEEEEEQAPEAGGPIGATTLAPTLKTLQEMWREWQFGIGGRKPAKDFTPPQERGNPTGCIKQTYYRRKCVWLILRHLIDNGHNISGAINIMKETYGQNVSVTDMQKAIVRDRRVYKDNGGLHPNFRQNVPNFQQNNAHNHAMCFIPTRSRRKCVWLILRPLIDNGHNISGAINIMKETYGQNLRSVIRSQKRRRSVGNPSELSQWPLSWSDVDLEDIAAAVDAEYPASLQQRLIMETFADGGFQMDRSVVEFRSVVDFIWQSSSNCRVEHVVV
ncbi:hypothetical protein IV203_033617 [Nitzschia inconspicua]|uniref:Uncharacterized protein n=1 Tax=Nitzschia inconspicua TaxID=303405 RepID=A0A9K3M259_9STRA|nr:hypothetical protein IV203_033617 [Nitzschia inconspicua]